MFKQTFPCCLWSLEKFDRPSPLRSLRKLHRSLWKLHIAVGLLITPPAHIFISLYLLYKMHTSHIHNHLLHPLIPSQSIFTSKSIFTPAAYSSLSLSFQWSWREYLDLGCTISPPKGCISWSRKISVHQGWRSGSTLLTSGFDQGFTINTSKRVFRGIW
jgi:hypothetical protein